MGFYVYPSFPIFNTINKLPNWSLAHLCKLNCHTGDEGAEVDYFYETWWDRCVIMYTPQLCSSNTATGVILGMINVFNSCYMQIVSAVDDHRT